MLAKSTLLVKVIGKSSRSNITCFAISGCCHLSCFEVMIRVEVKVKGQSVCKWSSKRLDVEIKVRCQLTVDQPFISLSFTLAINESILIFDQKIRAGTHSILGQVTCISKRNTSQNGNLVSSQSMHQSSAVINVQHFLTRIFFLSSWRVQEKSLYPSFTCRSPVKYYIYSKKYKTGHMRFFVSLLYLLL